MKQIKTLLFLLCAFAFIGFAASEAQASHFRYGNVSYKPILNGMGNPTGTVEFKIREGWRRSAFGSLVTGNVVTTGTFYFGDGGAVNTTLTVTSYSATEDWFIGEMTVTHFYSGAGPYIANVFSCCRIGNLNNGSNGNFRYETIVRPYSANSSPTTALPPIVSMAVASNSSFTVVGSDINGDTLRYRMATPAETGISQPPGIGINSTTGVVTWNTIGLNQTNFWSAQFVIEDLDGAGNVKSKTPVDVLIKLVTSVGTPPQCLINGSASGYSISVSAGTPVSFTLTGSDADIDSGTGLPNTPVTLNVSGLPIGAVMSPTLIFTAPSPANSNFSWTPTAANAGTNAISFSCTDNTGQQTLNSASIFVQSNQPPTLSNVPASATIDELANYSFTATATDTDVPTQTLTFSLVGAPSGASINPSSGVLSWTPDETQGPGMYSFIVRVSDGLANADAPISLTVNEVNSAPVLAAIGNQTVDELVALSGVTASATDSDIPANSLVYSLDSAPAGMTIDGNSGAISWTPSEAQGAGDYPVTVRVTDNGTPNLSDTKTFNVHVNEVNVAPELAAIGNSTIDEQVVSAFNASASDADLPANGLTFSLVGAPSGASITSGGAFSWTPTEAQGPGSYTFTVKVTDDGTPALSDEEQITITVNEVNRPPVLNSISNQTGFWGNVFGFTATASDPDIPANALTFSLIGAPAGAAIDPNSGAFSWTPLSSQIGSHTFTVRVTDNGSPNLSDEQIVTINVGKRPTTLVYTGDGAEQYSDQQALTATLTDAGGGAMNGFPLSGKTVGFAIGSQNASDATDASGAAITDLILTQNPNLNYMVNSSFVGDASYLGSNDSDAFDITKEDARAYYTGTLFVNTSCATCSSGTVTLSATVKDITAETSDPAFDNFEGDIRNATVTFINRDTNTVIASNVPVGLVNAGDTKVGTAVYNWNVNIGSTESLDYTIGIIVNHYYTRNSSDDNTLVTVSKPIGTNFITGGGYLVMSDSNGQYAGLDGTKSNFGFNVKYNNSGTNLKGRVNVIVRGSGGRVYQIKGNVMRTLSVKTVSNNPLVKSAVFTGKANITDITDPLNPIALGGNNTLQMELTDKGEPGNTDTMGISLLNDDGGLLFSSNWNGTRTIEQILGGGNLVVR